MKNNMKNNKPKSADGVQKVGELIKDIKMAMLVTLDEDGRPHSRPMQTQDVEFDGTVWFFTSVDSEKVKEVENNPYVNVAYASGAQFVSLTGIAEVLQDAEKTHAMWNPLLKAWFDSADDPKIRLIRVDAESAEYWDTPGGRIASFISLVTSAVTGKRDESSENEIVLL